MSKRTYVGSTRAVLGALMLIGVTATGAQAQDVPAPTGLPLSGTFETVSVDTNGDGIRAFRQSVRVIDAVLGDSTIEGLTEFGQGVRATCPSGNRGVQLTLLTTPGAPAALVQRFDSTGDLLTMAVTAASACQDLALGKVFLEATGNIVGGTGALVGATGTFRVTGEGSLLFLTINDLFGAQQGTLEQSILLP